MNFQSALTPRETLPRTRGPKPRPEGHDDRPPARAGASGTRRQASRPRRRSEDPFSEPSTRTRPRRSSSARRGLHDHPKGITNTPWPVHSPRRDREHTVVHPLTPKGSRARRWHTSKPRGARHAPSATRWRPEGPLHIASSEVKAPWSRSRAFGDALKTRRPSPHRVERGQSSEGLPTELQPRDRTPRRPETKRRNARKPRGGHQDVCRSPHAPRSARRSNCRPSDHQGSHLP